MADRRRLSLLAFVAIGLAAAAALVILVAPRASSSPDGLERVAAEKGIDVDGRPHALGDGPFADYGTTGVDDAAIGTDRRRLGRDHRHVRGVRHARLRRAPATGPPAVAGDLRRADPWPEGTATSSCTRRGRCTAWHRSASCWRRSCSSSPWSPPRRSSSGRSVCTPASSCWRRSWRASPCSWSPGASSSRCRSCCSRSCCRCSARDPTVDVLGLQLSQPGLWAAWNIVAKGTIGVAASIVLASTTSVPHVLQGLERLHVPRAARRHHRLHGPLRRRDR